MFSILSVVEEGVIVDVNWGSLPRRIMARKAAQGRGVCIGNLRIDRGNESPRQTDLS